MRHILISCLLFSASAATAQTPVPVGDDFQVNTLTPNHQSFPSVATRANGDFIVTWSSIGSIDSDNSGYSIQGQRFASDGSTLGQQFQINSYSMNDQEAPAVAVDADGDFVVVWTSDGSSGSDNSSRSIQGQRYAADGSTLGGQFEVNTFTMNDQRQPAVAVEPDGDFIVVWESYGSGGDDNSLFSIQGQKYFSTGDPIGGQFQVNSYTTNDQQDPAVAVAADGDFVVVWDSDGSTGSDNGSRSIQGQRFAANGSTLGGEFQVNSFTANRQYTPVVAVGADSDFVVVWTSTGSSDSDNSGDSVQGQRFAADGSTLAAEFQVNTYTPNHQFRPAVATDGGGHFIVAWETFESSGPDNSSRSIQGQRFAAGGTMVGGQFQVNSYSTDHQARPSVASVADGDFVVAWASLASSGNDSVGYSVQVRRFAVPNTPPVVTINSPLDGEAFDEGVAISFAAMAIDPEEGDLSAGLAWSSDRDGPIGNGATFMDDTLSVGAHRVTATGVDTVGAMDSDSVAFGVVAAAPPAPIGGQITPTFTKDCQARASVAADAAGRFVATWQSEDSGGGDVNGFSIQVRRYDTDGTPFGGELQVNTFTAGDQTAPAVGVTPAGAFVVAWQSAGSAGSDTDGTSIQALRYDASGMPLASDFQVNATTSGDQASPAIGVDSGGAFVVAWHSPAQDGNGLGVVAQRYTSGGTALGGEIQVNAFTTGDQSRPAISVDSAGDFLITWQSDGSAGDDGDGTSIQARAFSAAGAPLSADVQINATTLGDQRRPALCRFTGGDVMIAWDSEHESPLRGSIPIFGIRGRQASFAAAVGGDEAVLSADSEDQQREPALTCQRTGDFLAVWQHQVATVSPARGSIPIFNLRGAAFALAADITVRLSPLFDLDADVTDLQELPAVAAAGEDGFVVFWQTDPALNGDTDIVGQRFDNPVPPPPIEVFGDGFESGDTVRWSTAVP